MRQMPTSGLAGPPGLPAWIPSTPDSHSTSTPLFPLLHRPGPRLAAQAACKTTTELGALFLVLACLELALCARYSYRRVGKRIILNPHLPRLNTDTFFFFTGGRGGRDVANSKNHTTPIRQTHGLHHNSRHFDDSTVTTAGNPNAIPLTPAPASLSLSLTHTYPLRHDRIAAHQIHHCAAVGQRGEQGGGRNGWWERPILIGRPAPLLPFSANRSRRTADAAAPKGGDGRAWSRFTMPLWAPLLAHLPPPPPLTYHPLVADCQACL